MHEGAQMDQDRAKELLLAARTEVQKSLNYTERSGRDDRATELETGDIADPAQSLTAEGTYGRSIRSGLPIPDERLEADPAAELTIEEARQDEARQP
jgi:DnaK suppressor protein